MQYILARRGYPPGAIDAVFGPMTGTALRNFQSALGLSADGLAGPATIAGLRHGSASRGTTPVANGPVRLLRPVPGSIGDRFGAPARGPPHSHRDRLPGRCRHARGRRRRGRDRVRRLELRRLRQPRRDPPPARLHHLVRAPVLDHHLGGRGGNGRHTHRLRRLDRTLHRPAPALRAAQERGADRPDAVPAAGRGHAGELGPGELERRRRRGAGRQRGRQHRGRHGREQRHRRRRRRASLPDPRAAREVPPRRRSTPAARRT